MSSIFGRPHPEEPSPEETPPEEIHAPEIPSGGTPPAAAPVSEAVQPAAAAPAQPAPLAAEGGLTPPINLQPYLNDLLNLLRPLIPDDSARMPPNSLSVVELEPRSLGLGGRRGMYQVAGMDVAELRGGWLKTVIRFDLWGPNLNTVNILAVTLQSRLLESSLTLRQGGVLQIKLAGASDGPSTSPPNSWRKSLDYSVLYEYHYQDADGAAGLIARIPIHVGIDTLPGEFEITEVSDWMVLWDNQGAPTLEIAPTPRGQATILSLTTAAYLPGPDPTGQVTQVVVRNGGTTTTNFDSISAFIGSFALDSNPLTLVYPPAPLNPGETQEFHDFEVGELRFDPPIVLKGGGDLLRISFSETSFPVDNPSQVYLRALGN